MRTVLTIEDLLPLFGLRVRAGSVELRALRDEDLPELCDLALGGIHPPGEMPFYVPWTEAPREELARNTAQYHWRNRADFAPSAWTLDLGVWHDGELVGCQGVSARGRSAGTGWRSRSPG